MKNECSEYAVGMKAEFSKTVSEYDVYCYAGVTGDFNSIHINQEAGSNSIFKDRIAHGLLVAGFISTVIGTKLPGEGTIYLEQNLKFVKPVYIGTTITATVTIEEIVNAEKGILKLKTIVTNEKNENVMKGFAIVKAPNEDSRWNI